MVLLHQSISRYYYHHYYYYYYYAWDDLPLTDLHRFLAFIGIKVSSLVHGSTSTGSKAGKESDTHMATRRVWWTYRINLSLWERQAG
jgi:hypothetical protein